MTAEQEDALLDDIVDYLDERGPGTPVGANTVIPTSVDPDSSGHSSEEQAPMSGNESVAKETPIVAEVGTPKGRVYVSPSGKEYPRQVYFLNDY